jgi:drug/metabolite transporter (DMT)-like permease
MSPHALGLLFGLLGGISLSLGGPIVRLLSEDTGPWQFLAWRSYAFTILMFTIALWRAGSLSRLWHESRKIGWLTLPIALTVGFGQICYILGLLNTLVANVTFIVGSAPIFTAFAAWLILGERLTWPGMAALLAAVGGVGIMFSAGLAPGDLLGNLFAIGAMIAYVAYVLLLRHARDIDTFVASGFGGLIGLAFAVWMAAGTAVTPPKDLLLALLSGTIQVGAGFAFATLASKLIPAAEVTLLIMTEAVLGPILVWLLISETPPALTLVGGAVIIVSVTVYAALALVEERRLLRRAGKHRL